MCNMTIITTVTDMYIYYIYDMLTLSKMMLIEIGKCEFGVLSENKSGVEEGLSREAVVL